MKTQSNPNILQKADEQMSLEDKVKRLEETCENCHPLPPITCITNCKVWMLKNEFRELSEKMRDPNYMKNLLNALKNKRRFKILEIITKEKSSINRLQEKLSEQGYDHSQETIIKEYVKPLLNVGLVEENQNHYRVTLLGSRLCGILRDFHGIEDIFPPHSECHEEIVLGALSDGAKTFGELKATVSAGSIARVLNRLQEVGLVRTSEENDYVFYFKTKRDSDGLEVSPTEKRVYGNISNEGIPAKKIAAKTGISLRRTYKYLRKLRGKKLVFARTIPKSYGLTANGVEMAVMLKRVHDSAVDTLAVMVQLVKDVGVKGMLVPDTYQIGGVKNEKEHVSLATLRRSRWS
jgi:predicted transcriptional regulator